MDNLPSGSMSLSQFFIYLAIMVAITYLIRAIPFAVINRQIKNKFIRSFLFYIPYAVLSAMTFPSALYITGNMISAAAGLAVAIIFALRGHGLTFVACVSCLAVYITGLIIQFV